MYERYEGDRSPAAIRGQVELPGVNLLTHPRCGDADRQWADDRVNDAYSRGYLDQSEAEARRDAIGKATTAEHLDILTSDLPAVSRWSGASLPAKTSKAPFRERFDDAQPVSGMLALAASVLFGTVPAYLGIALGLTAHHSQVYGLVACPTIILGALGVAASVVSMFHHYE
jgi:Domain of unknown function (DUF1707)